MKYLILFICLLSGVCYNTFAQHQVHIIGQMKDVMWKGKLSGNLDLKSLSEIPNLYGLGPVEYLRGEILILNSKPYISTVHTDTSMILEESMGVKAPFFGYASVPEWYEVPLPESIQSLQELEAYLDQITQNAPRPFLFKLEGRVEYALIHIVNLPPRSKVKSPDDAHKGIVKYPLQHVDADILGFFSTEHKTIFTHHDTFIHMHLITHDRQKMGHLDAVQFQKGGIKLFLPNAL